MEMVVVVVNGCVADVMEVVINVVVEVDVEVVD